MGRNTLVSRLFSHSAIFQCSRRLFPSCSSTETTIPFGRGNSLPYDFANVARSPSNASVCTLWLAPLSSSHSPVCGISSRKNVASSDGFANEPRWRLAPATKNVLQERTFSTSDSELSLEAYNREVEALNREFVEARDQIEIAVDSKETVYFNEEAAMAKELVSSVLQRFRHLLSRLDPERRGSLERFMGLKMAQLEGELKRALEEE